MQTRPETVTEENISKLSKLAHRIFFGLNMGMRSLGQEFWTEDGKIRI